MKIFENVTKKIIYTFTTKPDQYVHVDKPRTLQDHRQIQFNNWCKIYGVYNGSYLPKSCDKLLKKGWVETTSANNNSGDNRSFKRKSNNQEIRFDYGKLHKNGTFEPQHYHWNNPSAQNIKPKKMKNKQLYLDRYGGTCARKSLESHLSPLDKDYEGVIKNGKR